MDLDQEARQVALDRLPAALDQLDLGAFDVAADEVDARQLFLLHQAVERDDGGRLVDEFGAVAGRELLVRGRTALVGDDAVGAAEVPRHLLRHGQDHASPRPTPMAALCGRHVLEAVPADQPAHDRIGIVGGLVDMHLALRPDLVRQEVGMAAVRAAEVQADVARLHHLFHVGGFRLPFPVLQVALIDAHAWWRSCAGLRRTWTGLRAPG